MTAAAAGPTTATGDGDGSSPSVPPSSTSSYDAIPYSIGAFPQTRPDRLATIATLFGLRPAPPTQCRVLELGCASGGNLIPMALTDPRSTFVGVDLSRRQIEDGQAVVRELGLTNVSLLAQSITDIPDESGPFDYVLAHGVYSWVPPSVQEKILRVCSRNLAPQGVAYVSYNTYPGWHARGALRDMLLYHTRAIEKPADRVAAGRGLLTFLMKSAPTAAADGGYGALLRQELAVLAMTPDTYLLHEHLEEFNEPLYFHQFAARAARHGLQYLGEAQVSAMAASRFGPEVERTLRRISPDLLHMEQYMDFLRNRMFRQTLLCHADARPDHALRPDAVAAMYVASSCRPGATTAEDGAQEFGSTAGPTLTTRDPVMKAAMTRLAEHWPLPVHFEELVSHACATAGRAPNSDERTQLATRLLNCYVTGLVELSLSPPCFTTRVSERPLASAYAHLRARQGGKVSNARLESVLLDPLPAQLLTLLDGRHDLPTLARLLAASPVAAQLTEPIDQYIRRVLRSFARGALLVG